MGKNKVVKKDTKVREKLRGYTPTGVAQFVHLNAPDVNQWVKKEEDAKYSVTLVMDKEVAEAFVQPYKKLIEDKHKEAVEGMDSDLAQAYTRRVLLSIPKEKAEDGTYVENKSKRSIKFTSSFQPVFVDGKGQVIPKDKLPEIWSGSKIKLAFTYTDPIITSLKVVTIPFYLTGVQIIELRSKAGEADGLAGFEGFDAVEGGFDGSNLKTITNVDNKGDEEVESPYDSGDF